jgi:hypothetical protein
MRTIETTALVDEHHQATIQFPPDIAPGRHAIVVVVEAGSVASDPDALLRDDPDAREALRQRAFARMREGMDLGGRGYTRREELYDRFDR